MEFPSGRYNFISGQLAGIGPIESCSLFSPMGDFTSHKDATDVARAVMEAIFDPAHRADTDRAADIRAMREVELTADKPAPLDPAPSRRAVLTGGLASGDGAS